jgi:hypothetical protein
MIFSTISPRPVIFATFHQGKVEDFYLLLSFSVKTVKDLDPETSSG